MATKRTGSRRTVKPSRRGSARRVAMQALFQWQMTRQPVDEVERLFHDDAESIRADLDYFHELLHGVTDHHETLDAMLVPALDRPIEQVDPVERALLRLGAFELRDRLEIPYRVIINEAVDLAHTFGAEQSHRYVNAVLDVVAHATRPQETGPRTHQPPDAGPAT